MATNRRKRTRNLRPPLSESQLHYLKTGSYGKCPETYLWRLEDDVVRAAFLVIREDYPRGHFEWAEKEYGGGAGD